MARTWKTIAEWGHSHSEIAETFGRPRRTVSRHINDFAAEFEPPSDPSYQVIQ
jgi:phage regulator Rha-like protein